MWSDPSGRQAGAWGRDGRGRDGRGRDGRGEPRGEGLPGAFWEAPQVEVGQGPMVDKAKASGSFLTPSEASCGQAHVGHWTSGHK